MKSWLDGQLKAGVSDFRDLARGLAKAKLISKKLPVMRSYVPLIRQYLIAHEGQRGVTPGSTANEVPPPVSNRDIRSGPRETPNIDRQQRRAAADAEKRQNETNKAARRAHVEAVIMRGGLTRMAVLELCAKWGCKPTDIKADERIVLDSMTEQMSSESVLSYTARWFKGMDLLIAESADRGDMKTAMRGQIAMGEALGILGGAENAVTVVIGAEQDAGVYVSRDPEALRLARVNRRARLIELRQERAVLAEERGGLVLEAVHPVIED